MLPQVEYLITADTAIQEANTGKISVIGVFQNVTIPARYLIDHLPLLKLCDRNQEWRRIALYKLFTTRQEIKKSKKKRLRGAV